MAHKLKITGVLSLLLGLLCLSACSLAAPESTPTIDLNPFRTEVAATVLAQVTLDLVLTPSPTSLPSPTATFTQTPRPTQPAAASPTLEATSLTGTPGVGAENRAEWVSQTIPDGTTFLPGEAFTITWRLKNAGDSIWTALYRLRFYSGEPFGAPNEILLNRIILPGETADISIPMVAPARPGDYRTDWVLANENRSNFKQPVFLKIAVANPPTATSAPTATSQP